MLVSHSKTAAATFSRLHDIEFYRLIDYHVLVCAPYKFSVYSTNKTYDINHKRRSGSP